MAKLRPDGPHWTRRSLELTLEARRALHTAAWHGFAEDGETDPPGLTPSRAWVEDLYRANRGRLVAEFLRSRSFLAAWPVATFEPDPDLRREAQNVVAEQEERRKRLARQVAAEERAKWGQT
ncbi:MAG: hypothetical protein M3404_08685 [Actinomycetota bacterium]|nr:hypothetical protein [Actinomycetota bacterium]